ncbi:hypothetical protein [Herbaspirillum sp. NPDC087042]|uniref:hypothetical protein n=1 Tax=Herbaspirillum sp. NPDC087042 TaxID=3364004 RepID=UPI00381483EE
MKGWIVLEDFLLLLGLLGFVGSIGMRWVLRKQPAVPPVAAADAAGDWRDEPLHTGPASGRPRRKRRCR